VADTSQRVAQTWGALGLASHVSAILHPMRGWHATRNAFERDPEVMMLRRFAVHARCEAKQVKLPSGGNPQIARADGGRVADLGARGRVDLAD